MSPLAEQSDRVAQALPDLVVQLIEGLPADDLERACCRAWRLGDVGHRAAAFYLEQLDASGLHQKLGFSSATHFARMRLGMAPRTARDLVSVGRALRELPRLDEAFMKQELCWTKVRLVARVAVPETEVAWIARARELNTEQLEREVRGSEKGRPPRSDRKGTPEVRYTVRFQLDAVAHELWEQAHRRLSDEAGNEVSASDMARSLAEQVLRGGGADAPSRQADSLYRVVVDQCPDCRDAAVRTDAGPEPITETQAEAVCCDALPVGRDKPTDTALRKRVLTRDGFRCKCCGTGRDLAAHHIVFRSHGGPTTRENLVTLCIRCHALVHDGKLRIKGRAPHGLEMKSADGRPLDEVRSEGAAAMLHVGSSGDESGADTPSREGRVTFARLPKTVEAGWWKEHRHLLEWHDRKGVLTFTDGERRIPDALDVGEDALPSGGGDRPTQFADIIGQRRAVRSLGLAVNAARARRTAVDPILFHGPPGLGKTTLARAVATEMEARLHATSAPLLTDIGQLVGLLTSARDHDVILIDEIHALPRKLCEVLYEAMEDGILSLAVAQGSETRTLRVAMPQLTIIGATTDPNLLPRPLLDRFGLAEERGRSPAAGPSPLRLFEG